jgi:TOM7 family
MEISIRQVGALLTMQLSEETKVPSREEDRGTDGQERMGRVIDLGRLAVHYGWIPLILYVGRRVQKTVDADGRVYTKFAETGVVEV